MKIGAKIGTGLGTLVIMLLVISGVGIWELNFVIRGYSRGLMSEVTAEKHATRIPEDILKARQNEKDFLAGRELYYTARTRAYIDSAFIRIRKLLESTGNPEHREMLKKIRSHLNDYLNTLVLLEQTVIERGLNENEGIHGHFREAAHAFERAVEQAPVRDGMVLYLMARRHEKDYIQRDADRYIGRLENVLGRLRRNVLASRLGQRKKEEYIEFLNVYEQGFRALVAKDEEIKNLLASLEESTDQAMELSEKILRIKSERAAEHLRNINAESSMYVSLLWTVSALAVVLAILITWFLDRMITRPLSKVSAAAHSIAGGDLGSAVSLDYHTRGNDEIAQLSRAFKEMSGNLHRSNEEIRHIAYHDNLTGLPNRLMFKEFLEHSLESNRRQGKMFGVLFIDLDNFKTVNDTMGHDAGDQLLRECAERLGKCIRGGDYLGAQRGAPDVSDSTVARLGGDEFTILLQGIREPMDTAVVARRIIDELSKPFVFGTDKFFIGASIGITIFPDDGEEPDQLLKNADMAMYHAKDKGKNRYEYYTSEMNLIAIRKLTLESELRRAMEGSQFKVFFQPQVDCRTGLIVGVEALIRWLHPERGIVRPGDFIPLAEETGLINPMSTWVLNTVCRVARSWQDDGLPRVDFGVNFSSVQFSQQDVATLVREALDESRLEPHYLGIELTETALLISERKATAVLSELETIGVQVWMDDFGTGYSSLNHLKQFPMNGVKIDRNFVKDLVNDPEDAAITSAIIAMAHSLNLRVIAEGVEDEEQLSWLRGAGCDLVQGFLVGRPVPEQAMKEILGRQKSRGAKIRA